MKKMSFIKKIQNFSFKELFFLSSVFGLFFLPFIYVWAGFPFFINEDLAYVALGGVIPYSDAAGYYAGAEWFLRSGELDFWNMRRPLNALLLAVRLKLSGGDFQGALLIQAALCGIGAVFFARTVSRVLGTKAAFIAILICFFWAQTYIPTTMTEPLGLFLGLLATTLLIEGSYLERPFVFGIGMFVLTVGLNTRAGPFLILPFLFLWVVFSPLFKGRRHWLLFLGGGVILGFLYPKALLFFYGSPEVGGEMHANFAPTLYGLARGGLTWVSGYEALEGLGIIGESDQAMWLYKESMRLILENPFNLIKGLILNLCRFLKFFLNIKYVFGFFSYPIDWIFCIGVPFVLYYYGKCYKFFISSYKNFERIKDIALIGGIGCFFSAAITFDSGGIRTFAVGMPFISLLLVMPFASFSENNKRAFPKGNFLILFVTFITLLSGLILPALMSVDKKGRTSCDQGQNKEIHQSSDEKIIEVCTLKNYPFLNVKKEASKIGERPHISPERLSEIKNLEKFYLREDLEKLKSKVPYSIGLVFDETTRQFFLIVGPLDWFKKETQKKIQTLSLKHEIGFSDNLYFLQKVF